MNQLGGKFTFNYYYINTAINEQKSSYLNYVFNDKNYVYFDTNSVKENTLFHSGYTIAT